jgi:hypothetical protein
MFLSLSLQPSIFIFTLSLLFFIGVISFTFCILIKNLKKNYVILCLKSFENENEK